jgi:transcriptional regulator with XRE-family HTH domain
VITLKAEKLKKFRMAKGYNQTEFAEIIGIDRSYYNQIERGKVIPSMALLEKIAAELGKSLKDFF